MNIVLSILGIIFVIWISIVFIWNCIITIVFRFTDDSPYTSLKRTTCIYPTDFNEWYIIPSLSFHIDNICKYPHISFTWLKWTFSITYHFETEEEEHFKIEARTKYLKNKQK